ncbi:sporulation membrane protein YtrI [Virgibacillus halophilus]|uniref:sporulation membrane protein YtrI n=1 Tax=Tigheibacillus halophilus TaxID=361280 RepID=UPI0036288252
MHIPPYYKKPSWQRFLLGVFFGALAGYLIVIFMHGTMYGKLVEKNYELQSKVNDLQKQKEALMEDNEDLDQENNKPSTIEIMEIKISNAEELKLDPLIIHQLSDKIKKDLDQLIGLETEVIGKSDELIVSTIENKTYHVDDFSYTFTVDRMVVSSKLKLVLTAKISD